MMATVYLDMTRRANTLSAGTSGTRRCHYARVRLWPIAFSVSARPRRFNVRGAYRGNGARMAEAHNARLDRPVIMIGLMGAGKSTIGRRLGARLGIPFVDADAEIEKAAGSSIEDIFATHGEQAFRDGERRVIARLLKDPVHVLATGGGAFIEPATRELIRDSGVSVWLRAELDVLLRRVKRRNDRPLLKQGDPQEILRQHMEERYPIYAEADITIDTADAPHETVVREIIQKLDAFRAATTTGVADEAT